MENKGLASLFAKLNDNEQKCYEHHITQSLKLEIPTNTHVENNLFIIGVKTKLKNNLIASCKLLLQMQFY